MSPHPGSSGSECCWPQNPHSGSQIPQSSSKVLPWEPSAERETGSSEREAWAPSSGWRQGIPKGEGTYGRGPSLGMGVRTSSLSCPHPCFTPSVKTQHKVPGIRPRCGHGAWRGGGGGLPGIYFEIINPQVRKTRNSCFPRTLSLAGGS